MDTTVLGMPLNLDLGDEDYHVSPVCAMVVMKGIDNEGDEVNTVAFTDGMSPLDGLGFAEFARVFCDFQIRKSFYATSG